MYALVIAGPEPYEDFAVLRCDSSEIIEEKFDNITDCVNKSRLVDEWKYCGCHRPYKEWTKYYYNLVIPFIFAFVGLSFLRGAFWLRFSLLNVAVLVGGIVMLIYSINASDNYESEAGFFYMIYLVQILLTSSLIYAIFYWGYNNIKGKNTPSNKSLQSDA